MPAADKPAIAKPFPFNDLGMLGESGRAFPQTTNIWAYSPNAAQIGGTA